MGRRQLRIGRCPLGHDFCVLGACPCDSWHRKDVDVFWLSDYCDLVPGNCTFDYRSRLRDKESSAKSIAIAKNFHDDIDSCRGLTRRGIEPKEGLRYFRRGK